MNVNVNSFGDRGIRTHRLRTSALEPKQIGLGTELCQAVQQSHTGYDKILVPGL